MNGEESIVSHILSGIEELWVAYPIRTTLATIGMAVFFVLAILIDHLYA